jgi:deoxyadenosine/deoxycytidine kinase
MAFVVLEGFSGAGKTTLARGLERRGWLRLQESAHAVPKDVPLADRADTAADFSLFGATLAYCSVIEQNREGRNIVSEGYLLSDLAYAKIRFELKTSRAYPAMLAMCRDVLASPRLRPDLYVVLQAWGETIEGRQLAKAERDKNQNAFFRTRYYSALEEIHRELGEEKVARIRTDSHAETTLRTIEAVLRSRGVVA